VLTRGAYIDHRCADLVNQSHFLIFLLEKTPNANANLMTDAPPQPMDQDDVSECLTDNIVDADEDVPEGTATGLTEEAEESPSIEDVQDEDATNKDGDVNQTDVSPEAEELVPEQYSTDDVADGTEDVDQAAAIDPTEEVEELPPVEPLPVEESQDEAPTVPDENVDEVDQNDSQDAAEETVTSDMLGSTLSITEGEPPAENTDEHLPENPAEDGPEDSGENSSLEHKEGESAKLEPSNEMEETPATESTEEVTNETDPDLQNTDTHSDEPIVEEEVNSPNVDVEDVAPGDKSETKSSSEEQTTAHTNEDIEHNASDASGPIESSADNDTPLPSEKVAVVDVTMPSENEIEEGDTTIRESHPVEAISEAAPDLGTATESTAVDCEANANDEDHAPEPKGQAIVESEDVPTQEEVSETNVAATLQPQETQAENEETPTTEATEDADQNSQPENAELAPTESTQDIEQISQPAEEDEASNLPIEEASDSSLAQDKEINQPHLQMEEETSHDTEDISEDQSETQKEEQPPQSHEATESGATQEDISAVEEPEESATILSKEQAQEDVGLSNEEGPPTDTLEDIHPTDPEPEPAMEVDDATVVGGEASPQLEPEVQADAVTHNDEDMHKEETAPVQDSEIVAPPVVETVPLESRGQPEPEATLGEAAIEVAPEEPAVEVIPEEPASQVLPEESIEVVEPMKTTANSMPETEPFPAAPVEKVSEKSMDDPGHTTERAVIPAAAAEQLDQADDATLEKPEVMPTDTPDATQSQQTPPDEPDLAEEPVVTPLPREKTRRRHSHSHREGRHLSTRDRDDDPHRESHRRRDSNTSAKERPHNGMALLAISKLAGSARTKRRDSMTDREGGKERAYKYEEEHHSSSSKDRSYRESRSRRHHDRSHEDNGKGRALEGYETEEDRRRRREARRAEKESLARAEAARLEEEEEARRQKRREERRVRKLEEAQALKEAEERRAVKEEEEKRERHERRRQRHEAEKEARRLEREKVEQAEETRRLRRQRKMDLGKEKLVSMQTEDLEPKLEFEPRDAARRAAEEDSEGVHASPVTPRGPSRRNTSERHGKPLPPVRRNSLLAGFSLFGRSKNESSVPVAKASKPVARVRIDLEAIDPTFPVEPSRKTRDVPAHSLDSSNGSREQAERPHRSRRHSQSQHHRRFNSTAEEAEYRARKEERRRARDRELEMPGGREGGVTFRLPADDIPPLALESDRIEPLPPPEREERVHAPVFDDAEAVVGESSHSSTDRRDHRRRTTRRVSVIEPERRKSRRLSTTEKERPVSRRVESDRPRARGHGDESDHPRPRTGGHEEERMRPRRNETDRERDRDRERSGRSKRKDDGGFKGFFKRIVN
jgi:hypothetical protein